MLRKISLVMLFLLIVPSLLSAQETVPPLPELYTSADGSFQFSFPQDWWLEVGQNYVIVGSSEFALDTPPEGLTDGEGRAILLSYTPDQIEGFEGEVNATNIALVLAEQFSEEKEISAPAPLAITAGDTARVSWATGDSEVALLAVEVFEQTYIVAIVVAAPGELEKVEPVFVAMAATFNYRTEEEIEADNQALADRWNSGAGNLSDETPYYLVAPEGEAPAEGWPVIVALSDIDQDPAELLPIFADAANRRGYVFVVSGFGDYADAEQNRAKLDELLGVVNEQLDVLAPGVVLYGFGEGGVFVTDYLDEDTVGVAGVIAEGARMLLLPPENRQDIPYGVIYGETDPNLNSINLVAVDEIRSMGYALRLATISGAGHEITGDSVQVVFDMVELLKNTEFPSAEVTPEATEESGS